jgi:hypothetical protein
VRVVGKTPCLTLIPAATIKPYGWGVLLVPGDFISVVVALLTVSQEANPNRQFNSSTNYLTTNHSPVNYTLANHSLAKEVG